MEVEEFLLFVKAIVVEVAVAYMATQLLAAIVIPVEGAVAAVAAAVALVVPAAVAEPLAS